MDLTGGVLVAGIGIARQEKRAALAGASASIA